MSKGLRRLAANDLGKILEDELTGFGWPITIINPENKSGKLTGYSNDIAQIIDPDTGAIISGRSASINIRIQLLKDKGFSLPIAIVDANEKPWLVRFDDINGNSFLFKVSKTNPDRTIGLVTCQLEAYKL